MEKRFFTAIILSFAVLYAWTAFFVKPKAQQTQPILSQVYENKELIDSSFPSSLVESSSQPSSSVLQEVPKPKTIHENIETIETDTLLVKFTNIGGTIKSVLLKEHNISLPITKIVSVKAVKDKPFQLLTYGGRAIVYQYEDDGVYIRKSYTLNEETYLINASVEIERRKGLSNLGPVDIVGYQIDMSNLDEAITSAPSYNRDKPFNEYVVSSDDGFFRKNKAFQFNEKNDKVGISNVNWVGFRDRYYAAIIKPEHEAGQYFIKSLDDSKLDVGYSLGSAQANQSNIKLDTVIYVGPEVHQDLKAFGYGFEQIKKFYRFPLFDIIAIIIYHIMHIMHNIIPNWGICIMAIATLIYFTTYPLTLSGMSSMKKVQAIQPKVAELKEKYKNNPQKLNKEMMVIYKENKVNPIGGCLPFLFQMPIFIGLYQVLWRDVSFKGAGFLWIKDLSAPDALFTFPMNIPFVGEHFNLLPIIMMGAMFVQQKFSSKNMMASATPEQKMQQKMMTTIMPIIFGAIFYKFASGLTLYFTMFYIFSTFTQMKVAKLN